MQGLVPGVTFLRRSRAMAERMLEAKPQRGRLRGIGCRECIEQSAKGFFTAVFWVRVNDNCCFHDVSFACEVCMGCRGVDKCHSRDLQPSEKLCTPKLIVSASATLQPCSSGCARRRSTTQSMKARTLNDPYLPSRCTTCTGQGSSSKFSSTNLRAPRSTSWAT